MANKTYSLRVRDRGQITLPKAVREQLNANELTLVQVGDVFVLSAKQPQVPQLAEQFAQEMQAQNVSLADLLVGLAEERATYKAE